MTLTQLRQSFGLTQKQFAERLALARGSYAQYETGRRDVSLKFAQAVCKAFECEMKVTAKFVSFELI